ncbi:MAG: hypothetical protein COB85_05720, partial [Bacteroidetes bacterium]
MGKHRVFRKINESLGNKYSLLLCLFVLLFTLNVNAQIDCPACIVISEFAFDPEDGNNGDADSTGEFVELYNMCDEAVDIGCFVLCLTDEYTSGPSEFRRGDCHTIPSGTSIPAGGVYLMGGYGTNCTGSITTCDWPTATLEFNWHNDGSDAWNVDADAFFSSNVGSYLGVLNDGGEDLTLFDDAGTLTQAITYEGGAGFTSSNTETIGAVSGCASKSVTIPSSANHFDVGNSAGNSGNDEGFQLQCDSTWIFANHDAGDSNADLNPDTSMGCALIQCGCALTASADSTDVTCNSGTDGTTTVTPASGTGPYTFVWDAGTGNQTDSIATGLSAGTYYVTVTDGSGCIVTDSATVIEPIAVLAAITPDPAEVCVGINLILDGDPLGGSGTYTTHSWTGDTGPLSSTSIQNPTFNAGSSGTYNLTYTVTDDKGCTGTDDIAVTVNANPPAAITPDPALICDAEDLSLN